MKMSVSVPDGLWDEVRDRLPKFDSPSALVQQVLRQAVDASKARAGYAQPADDLETAAALEVLHHRLTEEARSGYQKGYRQGVELASSLSWAQLSWLQSTDLDIKECAKALRLAEDGVFDFDPSDSPTYRNGLDGSEVIIDSDLFIPYLGSHVDESLDEPWVPDDTTVEGLEQALSDVWSAVRTAPQARTQQADVVHSASAPRAPD